MTIATLTAPAPLIDLESCARAARHVAPALRIGLNAAAFASTLFLIVATAGLLQ